MSLWSGLRDFLFAGSRASSPPLNIVPTSAMFYGNGLGQTQPPTETLLRESLGVVDAATRAIANRISMLNPQVVVDRDAGSGTTETEILDDHPLKELLDHPHPNLSRSQLFSLTAQHIVLTGEAYWLKVGNGLRVPVELHPQPPAKVRPMLRQNIVTDYEVIDGNGQRFVKPADTMVRIFRPDPESPWSAEGFLGPIGITADAHKFASQTLRTHFQFDATPKVVIQAEKDALPPTEDDLARFYDRFREMYDRRNGQRIGLPWMLPGGFTAHELNIQNGSELASILEYWERLILKSFGVSLAVLGEVTSGDRSSAEANQWAFDRYTITPIANLIADALTLQLAGDFDEDIRVEFEDFVADDKDYELKREAQDLTLKVRSINEVRTDRMMDEVPWGEEPIGTKADVPYDPEAAAKRADAPPVAPAAPGQQPQDDAMAAPEEDRLKRLEAAEHARVRLKYRNMAKRAA